jgi:pimeloyl-ACP methyl ester carboxylesterase
MAFVRSNGNKIHWESNGSGPAVLLTHGYSVTSEMWAGQARTLASRNRIITWDLLGHGKSDSPDDPGAYSEERSLEDMTQVLEAAGERTAVFGGLSLGGYLSLAFYYRYPERVRGLLLCDTGPGFKDPAARDRWNALAEKTAVGLEKGGLDSVRDIQDKVVSTHQTAVGLIHSARGVFRQKDSRIIESLPNVKVPTLVVVGENDQPLLAGCHYMAKKIPGARLVVVPRSGHYPNVDEPGIFDAAVQEFLAEVG